MSTIKTAIELQVKEPNLKGFRQELRELTLAAQQAVKDFGEFSPEAIEAERRVAALRDRIDDFNDRVAAVNPDKFAQLNTIVTGVAHGFQAAQGAMALFGNESEDLQKTLIKLQGAMALAQGLEGLGKIQQQFKAIATTVGNQVVGAFSTLRGAIVSTGIGALVVAVGFLIERLLTLKTSEELAAEKIKQVAEELEKQKKATDDLNSSISSQISLEESRLKAIGASEKEINATRQQGIKNQLDNLERLKQGYADETSRQIQAVNMSGMAVEEADKKRREITVKYYEDVADTEKQIEKLQIESQQIVYEEQEKTRVKREESNKKYAENTRYYEEQLRQRQQQIELARIENERVRAERELELQRENDIRSIRSTELSKIQKDKLIELAEEQHLIRMADLNKKYATQLEKELGDIKRKGIYATNTIGLEQEREFQKGTQQIKLQGTQFDKSNWQMMGAFAKAHYSTLSLLAGQTMDAILVLNQSFQRKDEESRKKAFENNKKLQIANAIIGTINSIISIFDNAAKNPASIPFPAYPYIQAGIAGTYGFANVQKIRNTQYNGGSSSASAPNIGGSAPSMVTGSSLNENASGGKVYVLEGDIRRTQQRVGMNRGVSVVE